MRQLLEKQGTDWVTACLRRGWLHDRGQREDVCDCCKAVGSILFITTEASGAGAGIGARCSVLGARPNVLPGQWMPGCQDGLA